MEGKRVGEVVWFSAKKGYGYIKQDNGEKDMFVHWSNIVKEGFKTLAKGQEVEYEVGENHKGPQAINVTIIEK